MAFKRMKPVRRAASAPVETQLPVELRRAATLMDKGQWAEANDVLQDLHRRYPTRVEPLHLLLGVMQEMNDLVSYDEIVDNIMKLAPDRVEFRVEQAVVTLRQGLSALALERFRSFLQLWPDHPEAAKARKAVTFLEEQLTKTMDEAGIQEENRFELAARNDAVQAYILQARYKEARDIALHLLEDSPRYAPALNNLGLIALLEGESEESLAYAQRVLAFEPENVHALGNLARSLALLGRTEEVTQAVERMRVSSAFAAGKSGKIIETLSFLGDDKGVLAVYESALQGEDDALESPMPHHQAGAAALRLGQEEEAHRYWKEALKHDAHFSLTRENLADLKLPVGERNAPWAFSFGYWMQKEMLRDFGAQIVTATEQGIPLAEALETYLQSHPYVETLVPILLERGDFAARQFALYIAKFVKTPQMLKALQNFALSRNGPDAMRIEAANAAVAAGAMEGGTATLWREGEWKETLLMNWEIYSEGEGSHPPEVDALLERAYRALLDGEGASAETTLKQAMQLAPDAPDLLNNLASAYKMQGRSEEATELFLQIYDRFPDYFFGKINMAHLWIREGQLEDAQNLLDPLTAQKRLHVSEFTSLAQAQIELALAKGMAENARSWMQMWEQIVPDHPGLMQYRLRLSDPNKLATQFRKLRSGR